MRRGRHEPHPGAPRLASGTRPCVLCGLLRTARRSARSGEAAPRRRRAQATLYNGLGFDTCNAPSIPTLQAWLASPYRALGIYIGGANRACANSPALRRRGSPRPRGSAGPSLRSTSARRLPAARRRASRRSAPPPPSAEGTAAADDAIASASQLGLPAGSPIYFDMEGYALDNPACTQTVQTFLSAWVAELHAQGYLRRRLRQRRLDDARPPGADDDLGRLPTTSGSPTGTGTRASSATPTSPTGSGRATSGSTSSAAATTRPTAASRSTSTATPSTARS